MKVTVTIAQPNTPQHAILARCKICGSIVLFPEPELRKGYQLSGGDLDPMTPHYAAELPLNPAVWEILPAGTKVTLEQE